MLLKAWYFRARCFCRGGGGFMSLTCLPIVVTCPEMPTPRAETPNPADGHQQKFYGLWVGHSFSMLAGVVVNPPLTWSPCNCRHHRGVGRTDGRPRVPQATVIRPPRVPGLSCENSWHQIFLIFNVQKTSFSQILACFEWKCLQKTPAFQKPHISSLWRWRLQIFFPSTNQCHNISYPRGRGERVTRWPYDHLFSERSNEISQRSKMLSNGLFGVNSDHPVDDAVIILQQYYIFAQIAQTVFNQPRDPVWNFDLHNLGQWMGTSVYDQKITFFFHEKHSCTVTLPPSPTSPVKHNCTVTRPPSPTSPVKHNYTVTNS